MKKSSLLTVTMVIIALCHPTQADEKAWLLVPGSNAGRITATTSETDLRRIFGEENVESTEVYVGEGMTEPGTILFSKDPTKTIEVLWKNKNRQVPAQVRISQVKSVWRTTSGITIGTSLKEMESLNKKPFSLSGFGWDYSGTVISNNGGALREFDVRKLTVRLSPESRWQEDPAYNGVVGDKEIQSNNPAMKKFNPTVYQIIVWFN